MIGKNLGKVYNTSMNKQNIIIIFLVAVIFALVGWTYLDKKNVEVEETKKPAEVKDFYTVMVGNGPVEFDLPHGYGVYASGGYEGGYEFRVNVGKVSRDGYLHEAVPTIYIRDFVPYFGDPKQYKPVKPSEYVDLVSVATNAGLLEPKPMKLFGNKAVRVVPEADINPIIYGYLRADQLPQSFGGKEYSVVVDGTTYGSGKEFDQELFDMVVNSLRIKSN